MAGFCYWVPGGSREEGRRRFGLESVLDQQGAQSVCRRPGGEEPGLLIAHRQEDLPKRVDEWDFTPIGRIDGVEAHQDALIGWRRDARPRPEDLRRGNVRGVPVLLGDGAEWLVPRVRVFPSGTELPQVFVMEGGIIRGEVLDRFASLSGLALSLFEDSISGKSVTYRACWDLAVGSLGVGYRVTALELTILRALDDESLNRIFRVALDHVGAEEFLSSQEKKG